MRDSEFSLENPINCKEGKTIIRDPSLIEIKWIIINCKYGLTSNYSYLFFYSILSMVVILTT